MDFLTILLIGVGLSMDALAVAVTSGLTLKKMKVRNALKIAAFFGAFQALMPMLGWLAGIGFKNYITGFDHWIAFALLGFIGGKMLYESRVIEEEETKPIDYTSSVVLLGLAIATSIDALAVGVSFSMLKVSLFIPALIIGITTFILSLGGVYIGKKFGNFFENKIELIGGLILIGIGTKILIEHLFFA